MTGYDSRVAETISICGKLPSSRNCVTAAWHRFTGHILTQRRAVVDCNSLRSASCLTGHP